MFWWFSGGGLLSGITTDKGFSWRRTLLFVGACAAVVCLVAGARSDLRQEAIRLNTREVLVDVLVKDKRTGAPIMDLSRENFELLDNRMPRALSYFGRSSEFSRRPLALALVLDLRPGGGGRLLRSQAVISSISAALQGLPLQDEVAVVLTWVAGDGAAREVLLDFTRDRRRLGEILKTVPLKVGEHAIASQSGEDPWSYLLAKIVPYTLDLITSERRASRPVLIHISDGFDLATKSDREELSQKLIRTGAVFHSMLTNQKLGVTSGIAALSPLAIAGGMSFRTAQELAKRTGGEVVRVRKPEDYGVGLEKIIGDLAARYTLGFEVDENEQDGGRMHKLEVKVTVPDSRGKLRKVEIRHRRGYYPPEPKKRQTMP